MDTLLDRYSSTEQVVVGTKTVANSDRKWYTFWRPKYVERNIYEDVEYVDLGDVKEETLLPIEQLIEKNIQDAIKFTEQELAKLKQFFISEITRLEKIMQQRVNEIKELAEQTNDIEEKLIEHHEKREWLVNFISKLDEVLELKAKEVAYSE